MQTKADSGALRGGIALPDTRYSPFAALWRRLRTNRAALVALVFLTALILAALFAPWLAPHGYHEQFRGAETRPPLSRVSIEAQGGAVSGHREELFLLGTDQNARDTFSRLIYGARVSVTVGVLAALIGLVVGVLIGLASGFYQGWLDALLMRLTDTVFAFPSVLLAVAITAVLDRPSLWVVFLALGAVGWTGLARVVRAQVLGIKTLDYIAAAHALGVSDARILWRHILPNCLGPIVVVVTLSIGGNILGEAGLSFLGLGVQEPYPSWGGMLAEARENYRYAWWLGVFPGLAIVFTVLAFNLLGDGLRDAFDVRTKE
jgi:ABC-type dipeptide/oligopeptide/nickel transport system permease subunit